MNLAFPKRPNLDCSLLKGFVDHNFKFDGHGWKLYKRVENTVGKGDIAHYEQFLLFFTVFSKDLYCRHVRTKACLGKGHAFTMFTLF